MHHNELHSGPLAGAESDSYQRWIVCQWPICNTTCNYFFPWCDQFLNRFMGQLGCLPSINKIHWIKIKSVKVYVHLSSRWFNLKFGHVEGEEHRAIESNARNLNGSPLMQIIPTALVTDQTQPHLMVASDFPIIATLSDSLWCAYLFPPRCELGNRFNASHSLLLSQPLSDRMHYAMNIKSHKPP